MISARQLAACVQHVAARFPDHVATATPGFVTFAPPLGPPQIAVAVIDLSDGSLSMAKDPGKHVYERTYPGDSADLGVGL